MSKKRKLEQEDNENLSISATEETISADNIQITGIYEKFYKSIINYCHQGAIDYVRPLIENIDLNVKFSDGHQFLDFITHQNTNKEIIKLLINNKADFSDNKYCKNMLLGYVCKNDIDMVSFLLTAGADPHIATEEGTTPLHIATDYNSPKMVEALLKNGMKVDFTKFPKQPTALILAIQKNNIEITKLLLEAGANLNISNDEGESPLHIATDNNSPKMVEVLLKHGMKVDFTKFTEQPTALILAVQKNNIEITKLLLEAGADYKAKDEEDNEAINLAKKLGHEEIVSLIATYQEISLFPLIHEEFIQENFSEEKFNLPPHLLAQQQDDTNNDY